MLMMFTWPACTPVPEPIEIGRDQCVYCKMIISDQRYGAELVTAKGKIYKYDSAECLAAAYLTKENGHKDIHSLWVVDFNQTQSFIDARAAVYLHSEKLHSPMSLNLTAFSSTASAEELLRRYSGEIMTWGQVKQLVRQKWSLE